MADPVKVAEPTQAASGPVAEPARAPSGGGLLDLQRTAGNWVAGKVTAAVGPTEILGKLASAVVHLFVQQLKGDAPQQRIAAAAMRGFAGTLAKEVTVDRVVGGLTELAQPKHAAQFAVAFEAGLGFGFVSPVTDLFGIVVLAEQLQRMTTDLGRAALEHPDELIAEALALRTAFLDFLATTKGRLTAAELMKHIDEASAAAEAAAATAGSKAAHAMIGHFSGKEEDAEVKIPAGPAAQLEHLAVETRKKLTSTQWSRMGYNVGYDTGALVSNALLIAFSLGAGEAVALIGAKLGQLGGLLARAGSLVEKLGAAIGAIDTLVGAVVSKPMKWLEPIMKPFFQLLERLQTFLRKILGLAEKGATKAATTAVKKTAAKAPVRKRVATGEPPAKVRVAEKPPEPAVRTRVAEPTPDSAVAHVPESTPTPLKKRAASPAVATTAPPKPPQKAKSLVPKAPTPAKTPKTPKAPKSPKPPPKKTPGGPTVVEKVGAEDGFHPRLDPDPQFYGGSAHRHVVDQYDRPLMAEGWLRPDTAARHADQQWLAEQMSGQLGGTEASHLLASRFGGSGRIFNLAPLPRALNQGEIKLLENALASEMAAGRRVYVQAYTNYAGTGLVPSSVEYRVFVDHQGAPRQVFDMVVYASH
ncbi:hypothetical protein FDA94_09240 [Herbidospora galbida]|uniref:Type VII secretion system protein EssD-like domain-containing protein n=1 Tax=Herbidospora galbida TaxID=2575442 RepID=A0A4U3MLW7_9ACTN|nr:DNA/RNA non-specific endonuclease [Herbidospora galbida]TKK89564.1 hypothetical protein FDA94_09240 [Herbidospora galbida]